MAAAGRFALAYLLGNHNKRAKGSEEEEADGAEDDRNEGEAPPSAEE